MCIKKLNRLSLQGRIPEVTALVGSLNVNIDKVFAFEYLLGSGDLAGIVGAIRPVAPTTSGASKPANLASPLSRSTAETIPPPNP